MANVGMHVLKQGFLVKRVKNYNFLYSMYSVANHEVVTKF